MGHDLLDLYLRAEQFTSPSKDVRNACSRLNLYYIPSRYPDAFTSGAPTDKFSEDQAAQAMEDARHVIEFVREIGNFDQ